MGTPFAGCVSTTNGRLRPAAGARTGADAGRGGEDASAPTRLAAGAPAAPPDILPPPVFQQQSQAAPPPPSAPPPPEPEPGRRLEPIPLLRHGAAPEGGWNLDRLERWIEERGDRFPGRVEEWRYYIVYMRDFANVDGVLPSSFDRLVWDVFGELLG